MRSLILVNGINLYIFHIFENRFIDLLIDHGSMLQLIIRTCFECIVEFFGTFIRLKFKWYSI
jgi:hypothetical protein